MKYLSELPRISSLCINDDMIEIELENEIEILPDLGDDDRAVLCASWSGQLFVAIGKVKECENIGGPEVFTRLTIQGRCVEFSI